MCGREKKKGGGGKPQLYIKLVLWAKLYDDYLANKLLY